jgi:pyruvate dehydrogenase E2 component (dihydrolipoamide acetyltransferase)
MTTVTMPQAGQSMEEGTILRWRKQEGQQVLKGEVLLEIETDKATVEVEASATGFLRKILCPEGIAVPVRTPIAILAGAEEDILGQVAEAQAELRLILGNKLPGPAPPAAVGGAAASLVATPVLTAAQPVTPSPEVRASPAARRIARERGVDLGAIERGSGPGGRVLSSDVERAEASVAASQPVRRPLSSMRKAIARNLLISKQSIPHFYMHLTIDAGPLHSFYRAEKAKYPCSINDVMVSACARVIQAMPAFRSRLEGNDQLVELPAVNIGIAVGMEDGLRVPVLVGADRLSLREIANETRRIVEAAEGGRVEAMGQGVFTITNLGMFGVEDFSAIINPPEVAILAVGALRESVIVKEGALRAGRVMTLTLSADHRIVDGLLAARFLARLREMLEAPEQYLQ